MRETTCKTCRWWGEERQGCCSFVGVVESGPRLFEILATAADDHNLTALLVTGPDFGCIHHEEEESHA